MSNPADVIVWRGKVRRTLRKMVRDGESQTQTWVDDGFEEADAEVTIRVADLASDLAHRAFKSKASKAAAMHGRIRARLTNRSRRRNP